jgi:hypothetical protein
VATVGAGDMVIKCSYHDVSMDCVMDDGSEEGGARGKMSAGGGVVPFF